MSTKLFHRYLVINIFIVIFTIIFFSCKDKPNPIQSSDTPQIIKIIPDTIYIGNDLTITGKNFGTVQAKVNFKNDTSNIFKIWTDTLIKLQVPYKALSGNVSVTNSSGTSNEVYLKILNDNQMNIISINPIEVIPNDTVTIKGINIGITQGIVLRYDKKEEKIVLWTDTLVKFIYSGYSDNSLCIINSSNNLYWFNLKEIRASQITSISSVKIYSGMIVTINGWNFESSRSNSNVKFNNIEASEYLYWSNNNIKVRVPDYVSSGFLTVNKPRISSNQIEYEVLLKPIIESVTPQLANIGDKITIKGQNFGKSGSSVLINWRQAPIVTWSDNLIELIIPDSCTCGDVYVISSDSAYSNPFEYKLQNCGSKTELNGFNKVRIENVDWAGTIESNYTLIDDSIKIYYSKNQGVDPDKYYNWSLSIILVLKPGSLNLVHFRVGFSRFTPCANWVCYNRYLLEGIDISLNSYSSSNYTYIINNQYPEKFIAHTTETGEAIYYNKYGWDYQISNGYYNISNMKPIIITFYK